MMAKHRKPSPLVPLLPLVIGATVGATGLLVGTAIAAPNAPVAAPRALPPVLLPLPPLSVASAAWYLTPLPPATPAITVTAAVEKPTAFTVKATGTTGGLAARVVSAAIAQQGTPYVYGGAAPGGFDCSGLVQYAFRTAGITLPRTAAAQSSIGRPVSVSQLQPGDLLFFYSPVDHVVMYVGNGKIAEASQPGSPVHIRPMYLSGFAGARRVI